MSIDRVTKLEQALAAARELLGDYQRRHEVAEQSWARTCQQLQARGDFLESHVRAYEAFHVPGATEVAILSRHIGAVHAPEALDRQAFTERLQQILGE